MTKEAAYLLDRYTWTPEEEKIIRTQFSDIVEKFSNMDELSYEKVTGYFTSWLLGEAPKARLNYWMRKTKTTVEELNIWMTY